MRYFSGICFFEGNSNLEVRRKFLLINFLFLKILLFSLIL